MRLPRIPLVRALLFFIGLMVAEESIRWLGSQIYPTLFHTKEWSKPFAILFILSLLGPFAQINHLLMHCERVTPWIAVQLTILFMMSALSTRLLIVLCIGRVPDYMHMVEGASLAPGAFYALWVTHKRYPIRRPQ